VRFNSSRSRNTFGLRGLDGLRRELGLSSAKKMIGGCLWDYSARHYPLKTLNGRLSVVLGCPRVEPTETLGMIKSYPFKTLKLPIEG